MGKTAFMFPGQGAQYVGMGKDFYEQITVSKNAFETASEVVGFDLKKLCFEENEDINITEYTQIAMLTVEAAILYALQEKGIKSDVNIGLSLGEYGALIASGVLSYEDACKVVRQRGIFMEKEVPAGQGAMSAVLGLDAKVIEESIANIEGNVQIANYNCPGQIVISGDLKAVTEAGKAITDAGARRVIPLNVSGPFHSQLLKGAGEKLGTVLDQVTIHDIKIPYVANYSAQYVNDKVDVKELLKKQVYSSVKFEQSIKMLIEDGVTTFIEIGPGKTLSGFIKKISKDVTVFNVEKVEDMNKILV